ncbi:MAG: hypothetical protein AB7O66_21840 [Limisphaerales bacterium]
MNEFLASSFAENVRRLALGLETLDAGRGTRVGHPIRVVFHDAINGLPRPVVDRHDSCLHALLYQPGVADRVDLRFYEAAPPFPSGPRGAGQALDFGSQFRRVPRRFVPRRISFPILTQAQAELAIGALRVRRPSLFPGAAYDLDAGQTGVRGRVVQAGVAVRWVRVTATLPGGTRVVGRAHGDDRGEFLLLLSPAAGSVGELGDPFTVRITVTARPAPPVPDTPERVLRDPWWDLPAESADPLDPGDPELDPVSSGETMPSGYTATVTRDLEVPLGRVHAETTPFMLP